MNPYDFILSMPPSYCEWFNSFQSDGGYPGQGYVHRHGPEGKMFPKRLRKKARNRKGRR